jgi:hypothetical protein
MAVVAKANREPTMVVWLEGPEVTDETLRATAHRLLEEKRQAAGIGHVDLTHLVEGG